MAGPLRVRLSVLAGAKPKELILRLPTVIGRGGTANIKLPASTVSRHHCEIYTYEEQVVVRDLASSNGTIVNGHQIMAPTFLRGQDELTVGPVTMRLTLLASSAETEDHDHLEPAADLDEALPELASLPAPKGLPVTATSAETERPHPSTDDSVLRYAEPSDRGPSFVAIQTGAEASADVEELPSDSALQDFLRGLVS